MILTGQKIHEEILDKRITIRPFNAKYITTNSYDFHLGDSIKINQDPIIDPKKEGSFKTIFLPKEGYVLQPNTLYLGHTMEHIGSNHYVPIIRGRSSIGRIGLFVHITADLIDIGFVGQMTLMLHATQPVKIYPGMKIGQVTFWVPTGETKLYTGKYQGLNGPQHSQGYKDF